MDAINLSVIHEMNEHTSNAAGIAHVAQAIYLYKATVGKQLRQQRQHKQHELEYKIKQACCCMLLI